MFLGALGEGFRFGFDMFPFQSRYQWASAFFTALSCCFPFVTKEARERILNAPLSSVTTASSVPSRSCASASFNVNVPLNAFVFTFFAKSKGNSNVVLACLASSVRASLAFCAGIEKLYASDFGADCALVGARLSLCAYKPCVGVRKNKTPDTICKGEIAEKWRGLRVFFCERQ